MNSVVIVTFVCIASSFLSNAAVVRDDSGQFTLSYNNGDGTAVMERGVLRRNNEGTDNVLVKDGSFQFTSPEGKTFAVTYVADELGFRPTAAHLPKSTAPITPVF